MNVKLESPEGQNHSVKNIRSNILQREYFLAIEESESFFP